MKVERMVTVIGRKADKGGGRYKENYGVLAGVYSMLFEISPSEQERVPTFSKRT